MKPDEQPDLRVLSIRKLVSLALASVPGFPLVLGFKPTDDEVGDWSYISQSMPWLHTAADQGFATACENLREHRLAVVICATEEVHSRLEIRGRRIRRE